MKNINKLSIPASILIGCVILGGFYYFTQVNKQNSIERQQQAELSDAKEKQARDFSASQKEACLNIYKQESSEWNNTNGWRYDEEADDCYVQYKENPKKTEAQCDVQYKGEDGKVNAWAFTDWLLCYDGLFEKSF
jgi:nitrogen fixation-related uncharacterized protein